jgi:hypothetical protein
MTPEAVRHHFAQQVQYRLAKRADRHAIVNKIKTDAGCIDCGYNADAEALDFDHRDGSLKVANLAKMIDRSWQSIMAEIAKCDVRCAICHRLKTKERRKPRIPVDTGLSDRLGTTPKAGARQVHRNHLPQVGFLTTA